MKLSIIIVNYKTQESLFNCLESLNKNFKRYLNSKKFEIIIIDNASNEKSWKILDDFAFNIKLIKNKQNFGFAKANNQGIKLSQGEYVLLLNPDTIVYKYTLTRLVDYLDKHKEIAICTSKVILPNGDIDDASHRGFPTPWRAFSYFSGLGKLFPQTLIFNGYHLGYKNMDIIHEIDACVGAFMMVRRNVGEELNWLDEDYFWYGEDLDFCYRVKKKGYKILYIPDVAIMHYKGAASGIKTHTQNLFGVNKETKILATKARYEAMRIFYQKHYQNIYPGWLTKLILKGIGLKEKISLLKL